MHDHALRSIGILMPAGWEGGRQYFLNIVQATADAVRRADRQIELHVLCTPEAFAELRAALPSAPLTHFPFPPAGSRIREALQAFTQRCDVVFPWPYRFSSAPAAQIGWIPDLQHRSFPKFFSLRERWRRDHVYRRMLRSATTVMLSSRDCEQSVQSRYPVRHAEIVAMPFRSFIRIDYDARPEDVQRSYILPDRFFLLSNQWWIHKNHRTVLEALRILRTQGVHPVIVCTGDTTDYRSPSAVAALLQQAREFQEERQLFILGRIPRQDQLQLMRRCIAVLQPSLFEGWNTSVEEARYLGKPILLSDIPVHREQDPPRATFADPHDPYVFASALAHLWGTASPGPHREEELEAAVAYAGLRETFGSALLQLFDRAHRRRAL